MKKTDKLSLTEMIKLAEEIDNWNFSRYTGHECYTGQHNQLKIIVNFNFEALFSRYEISVNSRGLEIGDYKGHSRKLKKFYEQVEAKHAECINKKNREESERVEKAVQSARILIRD